MSYRQTHFNLTAERKYSCCATVLPTSQHQNTKDKKPLVCVTLTKGTPMVICLLIRTEQSAMSSHLWLYQHLASTKPKIPSLLMPNSKSVTEQDSQCLPWLHRLPLRHQKGNRMFQFSHLKQGSPWILEHSFTFCNWASAEGITALRIRWTVSSTLLNPLDAILITCNFDLSSSNGGLFSCSFLKNTLVPLCCSSESCKRRYQVVKWRRLSAVWAISKHHSAEQWSSDSEQPCTGRALFSVFMQVQKDNSCTLRQTDCSSNKGSNS